MEILRQEIIETQKARSELIKWKLLLVSALAAAGLGFAESGSDNNKEVLLCCIPFVCVYVDAQYVNLSLRIMGIATFFRDVAPYVGVNQALIEYENMMFFARGNKPRASNKLGRHGTQSWLVRMSSILFSGLVAVYGAVSLKWPPSELSMWLKVAMICFGTGGVVFHICLFRYNRRRRKIIEKAGPEFAWKVDQLAEPLPLKQSGAGKWQVENVPGNWIACCNEEDAHILSNAPVLLGQSRSSPPSDALASNLEEAAQKLEDHKIGFTSRYFRARAQSVRRNVGNK